ncbi:DUF3613 domain-containing protein [Guyparkeria sp.]|uniref:DUF3613 domain-containing protein n=1 Tax=Guyparkeria sp. TaxID=2035736 RepID=UPI0039710C88
MNVSRSLAGIVAALIALTAFGPAFAYERTGSSSAVETWLSLQREGHMSVPEHKRVEGEMSQRAYWRMLKSFEHDIPARLLDDDELTTGSGR